MNLEEFSSDALLQVDVSVSGEWRAGKTRDWRGEARSHEPVVAVTVCRRGGHVSWCKSERANPSGQPVRLLLGHHDSSGRDVQVNFSVGEGQVVSRTLVESPAYRPVIRPQIAGATGALMLFVTVEGSHQVDLLVLFLAGSDVKVGRNGLWHLKPQLLKSVPEAFRELLARGRTGKLAAA